MAGLDDVFCAKHLLEIFPPERTTEFFDALYGSAEEGAYDIRLSASHISDQCLEFLFELHQRPGGCLACNLTHGLPHVFARHPAINAKALAARLADMAGWPDQGWTWELGATREITRTLHAVPLCLRRVPSAR